MKKQKVHFLILIILLVVLVAGYFGLQEMNRRKEIKDLQKNSVRVFNNTEITELTYSYGDRSYCLCRQDGKWTDKENPDMKLDQGLVEGMLTVAANIPFENQVDGVTDFGQYGLEEPYLTIECTDGENRYVVEMGDFNNTIEKYFIRVNHEDTVYTTDTALYHTFTKSPESLKEKEK